VPETPVRGITSDSRQVEAGSLFVALQGTVADGHDYIPQAVQQGAAAVVYHCPAAATSLPPQMPGVLVAEGRRAAAVIADRYWDHPSGALCLVAVTGTNGKTTTIHLLEAIFHAAGQTTGMIGTLGWRAGDETIAASRTTPEAMQLQALLARMRDQGISQVSMELSSHAIDLDRAWGCSFAGAVFTNLSRDHLDWHGDLTSYRQSKSRLFTDYVDFVAPGKEMMGAFNFDSPEGRQIASEARCRVTGFGTHPAAQVRAKNLQVTARGSCFDLVWPGGRQAVTLPLVGPFNVSNALGAATCALNLGVDAGAIAAGLGAIDGVPGRLESVSRGQPFAVLVDYAHTDDALTNVLQAARALQPRQLICVFGCGGDRDRTKRPLMGRQATTLADLTIITSDNPRSEDPAAIVAEIITGVQGGAYQVELDRRQGIELALAQAGPGDVVLICGKGHEDYQEFADGQRIHFDDREVAARWLQEQGYGGA
jgi:UDP-N-acetylmuramoyl-L-alanyl-D-glutamate--2,6-diaminopimelate ligase